MMESHWVFPELRPPLPGPSAVASHLELFSSNSPSTIGFSPVRPLSFVVTQ